jgi:putative FmdB family regulatory protein
MPLYEYKCGKCEKHFDVIQKFSDEPLTTHEECGGPLERLVSAPAFHFKGTGWYVTDYAKSNGTSTPAKNEGGSDGKAEKKSDKSDKSESKSESRSESRSESKGSDKPSTSTPAPATSSSDSK